MGGIFGMLYGYFFEYAFGRANARVGGWPVAVWDDDGHFVWPCAHRARPDA